MKQWLMMSLMLAMMLSLGSCSNTVQKMRRKVQFQGIESVELTGLSTIRMDVRIKNQTAYNLHLQDAVAHLYYRDREVGSLRLQEQVKVPRRTDSDLFTSHWLVDVGNPLALLPILGKVRAGDLSELWVDLEMEGRGGPVPVNLSREKMPLSDFLRTFGVDAKSLTNIFN